MKLLGRVTQLSRDEFFVRQLGLIFKIDPILDRGVFKALKVSERKNKTIELWIRSEDQQLLGVRLYEDRRFN